MKGLCRVLRFLYAVTTEISKVCVMVRFLRVGKTETVANLCVKVLEKRFEVKQTGHSGLC